MSQNNYALDTLKVRAGYDPKAHNYAVQVPIYQTVSYELGTTARVDKLLSFDELGWLYSRIGNPTVGVLEERLAAIEGGTGAVAVASGMAAVAYTLLNLAEGGGHILTSHKLYGGTYDLFKSLLPKYGVVADFVDLDDVEAAKKAIRPDTKGVFVESVSNPNSELADLPALAALAHEHGIPLIVDNTFATPYLLNPIRLGADLVVYSATKGIGGHGAALGGVIIESGKFPWDNGKFPHFTETPHLLRHRETGQARSVLDVARPIAFTLRVRLNQLAYLGAALGPFDAYLILQGLETLSERVAKQVKTTETIVRFLEEHPQVSWVKHPSAREHKSKELAARDFPRGTSTVLAFGLKGTLKDSERFIDALRLWSFQANVGDARSLVINSPKTTHGELEAEEQLLAGVTPDTIRLSVGLEDPQDLLSDLEQALAVAATPEL